MTETKCLYWNFVWLKIYTSIFYLCTFICTFTHTCHTGPKKKKNQANCQGFIYWDDRCYFLQLALCSCHLLWCGSAVRDPSQHGSLRCPGGHLLVARWASRSLSEPGAASGDCESQSDLCQESYRCADGTGLAKGPRLSAGTDSHGRSPTGNVSHGC